MNKKGAEKILSIYWFAILVIVAGAIVAMVSIFYGAPYDVRDIESNIMINQVSDCLSENGKVNGALFDESGNFNSEFSLLDECNLNFETEKDFKPGESFSNEEQYYLEINIYDLNDQKLFEAFEGNSNFITDCEIDPENQYKRLVKCVDRDFYSVDSLGDGYRINVFSIIRKTEKNVN